MSHDFTPIPAGELFGLLSAKEQAAAINVHHHHRYWFMPAKAAHDSGKHPLGRVNARLHDVQQQDFESLLMSRFMVEGPEIEAITYREAHAERVRP
ncbi:hypothetical protein KTQ54_06070 [Komagataeibacter oboediens]|uniref:hypothetical protein n=1 Tax=Komagataeibacter oboediens TaxID=65958 RepID=UPI001C2C9057|nr:hypothetical protein [Komagataeibacter oboediens]MBV0888106.1 hypothetical protein [Komagataeibacter oboediens]MCK9820795.1 hypothetical protein [Komagataeibacter oboediens]